MSDNEQEQGNLDEYLEAQNVTDTWPGLVLDQNYRRTSNPSINYNGLAWALGTMQRNFDPQKIAGYYWPPGIPREQNITSYLKVLESQKYDLIAADDRLEEGWEKIAVYVNAEGEPRHFAHQLEDGKWESKLADLIDIVHDDLECLEGDHFGRVNCVVMRRRQRL
jgi:hypothetical protein